MTPLRQQLIKLASRHTGVDCSETMVILTISQKTAVKRLAELVDEGKVIRAMGGWQGRRIRWFTDPKHAKAFATTKRQQSPTLVNSSAVYVKPSKAGGPKYTVCPSGTDQRFTVAPGYRGEFSTEWQQLRGQR